MWLGRRFVIRQAHELTGLSSNWSWVVASIFLGGLLPALLLLWHSRGRGGSFLGFGTILGWRIVGLAYLGAFVFLAYLASRSEFRDYYANIMRKGLAGPSARFFLVIIPEHICIQGLVLRLALGPPERWPELAPPLVVRGWWTRLLSWLGLTSSPGFLPRLGLDGRVLAALMAQAWIFGWVHIGKDIGEMALSFPGGLALGYLAWRAQSVWPATLLHALTGATVIAIAVLFFGMPIG